MMKVLYNTSIADPWILVAQKLRQEQGYEPVYWIGYEADDSKKIIPRAFSNIIYHSGFDACKGIFPKEIDERFARSYLDIDFLKAIAGNELQALKMMDRMDPDRYAFNFMERQRHFRNLLKYWTACLDHIKPDLVITDNVPHVIFDYVLYLLCRFRGIKFITFLGSAFVGKALLVTDISSIGSQLDADYAKYLKTETTVDELEQSLPADILERYRRVKTDYSMAEPFYMKEQVQGHKKNANFFALTCKLLSDLYRYRDRYFVWDGFFIKGIPTFYKQRGQNIESSNSTILNYSISKLKGNAFRKKLLRCYNALAVEPDLNVPYVYVALHYQPEMTTSPLGDIFVDQRLCIEMLAKYLPNNYLLYVKEHASQFYSNSWGQAGRLIEFYQDLASYPQVRLLPMQTDPFLLMKNSKAVATVTGTAGWEAMVLGKPVIAFGTAWYEKYKGLMKIVDEKSAAGITPFINNFSFDEKNLLAYLHAFNNKAVRAYAHRGWKERMMQDETECVANLAECIFQTVCR